jgi:hypothetical protein
MKVFPDTVDMLQIQGFACCSIVLVRVGIWDMPEGPPSDEAIPWEIIWERRDVLQHDGGFSKSGGECVRRRRGGELHKTRPRRAAFAEDATNLSRAWYEGIAMGANQVVRS